MPDRRRGNCSHSNEVKHLRRDGCAFWYAQDAPRRRPAVMCGRVGWGGGNHFHCNSEAVWHNYKVIIPRQIQPQVSRLLEQFPAVAILGPRQVGKTTLATALAEALGEQALYLDLELPSDRAKMTEPWRSSSGIGHRVQWPGRCRAAAPSTPRTKTCPWGRRPSSSKGGAVQYLPHAAGCQRPLPAPR